MRNGLTLPERNTGEGWVAPQNNYVVRLIIERRDVYHSLRPKEPGACQLSLLRGFEGRVAGELGAVFARWWKTPMLYHRRLAVVGRHPLSKEKIWVRVKQFKFWSVYLPKMVSRRWPANKIPVARMRNLAKGVITLFRQNIVTLTKMLGDKVCEPISPPWNVRQDRVPLEDGVEESR